MPSALAPCYAAILCYTVTELACQLHHAAYHFLNALRTLARRFAPVYNLEFAALAALSLTSAAD